MIRTFHANTFAARTFRNAAFRAQSPALRPVGGYTCVLVASPAMTLRLAGAAALARLVTIDPVHSHALANRPALSQNIASQPALSALVEVAAP